MNQYDIITAKLTPTRTDNLAPGVAEWIGRTLQWEASWVIPDDGVDQYAGDWHMTVIDPPGGEPMPFSWAPMCDLTILQEAAA